MKLPTSSGIYLIRNTRNNHTYVGSAVNIANRVRTHRRYLRSGKHHSPHLQNAWAKYGEDCFAFSVIHTCSAEELIPAEQHWIDTLSPEYNIARVAGSTYGYRFTKAQKHSLAESRGLLVEHLGELTTISAIAEVNDVSVQLLWRRVVKQGMTIEAALSVTMDEVFSARARKQHAARDKDHKAAIRRKIALAHTGKTHAGRYRYVEVSGERVAIHALAERLGVPYQRLYRRFLAGMPIEEVIRTAQVANLKDDPVHRELWVKSIREGVKSREYVPMSAAGREAQREAVRRYNKTRELSDKNITNMAAGQRKRANMERFEFRGELVSIGDLAEQFGICRHVLRKRVNAGWSLEEAVSRPVTKKPRKQ